MAENTEKTASLKIPEDLKDRLKVHAAKSKQGMNEMAADVLEEWLTSLAAPRQQKLQPTQNESLQSPDVASDTISRPAVQVQVEKVHLQWVNKLVSILTSGDEEAIDAICSNLAVFARVAQRTAATSESRESPSVSGSSGADIGGTFKAAIEAADSALRSEAEAAARDEADKRRARRGKRRDSREGGKTGDGGAA